MKKIYKFLDHFFWKTLCCRPDGGKIYFWWYAWTGKVAGFFHKLHCDRCKE